MSKELIINSSLPEIRIALLEDGKIQELLVERDTEKTYVGNIYKGKVTRVLPGMQAAFVDIGLEKAAFLYVDDVYVHDFSGEAAQGESEEEYEGEEAMAGADGEMAYDEEELDADEVTDEILVAETDEAEAAQNLAAGVPSAGDDDITREMESAASADSGEAVEDALSENYDEDDAADEGEKPESMSSSDSDSVEGETVGRDDGDASDSESSGESEEQSYAAEGGEGDSASEYGQGQGHGHGQGRRHHRGRHHHHRGRGGRDREGGDGGSYPDSYLEEIVYPGSLETDRTELSPEGREASEGAFLGLAESDGGGKSVERHRAVERSRRAYGRRIGFKQKRGRDRKIRGRNSSRPIRRRRNIDDVLSEGMEVIVQVAKDPIAAKGARLTCHVSLPGRHLVCMPTINHIGVSKRIESSEERRSLRTMVENNRSNNLGFIVRTASGVGEAEGRIRQDMEYLSSLWEEILVNSKGVGAPALIYEDLNPVLRTVRDWVEEDVSKIRVDSRYVYNEIKDFSKRFMPDLEKIVELYHGDVPIFDAFGISTELHRSLERRVWLKSGGYIVIDQAEALVAIDVNTGRYVGKKNLEDTILKTNLEAVDEIAHQLRVRNLGGIIIIDLIDMEKFENRRRVYRALENAIRKDRTRPTIVKISELGLIEMTRKRTRDTMVRVLCQPCNYCEGRGFIKSKMTIVYEILREIERAGIEKDARKVLVQAHPDVIDMLALDESSTLNQLERRYKKQVFLQSVGDFHPEQFEVVSEKAAGRLSNPGIRVGNQRRDHRDNRDRDRDRDRDRGRNNRDRDRGRGGRNRHRHDRDRDRDRDRGDQPRFNRDRERDSEKNESSYQQGAGPEQDYSADYNAGGNQDSAAYDNYSPSEQGNEAPHKTQPGAGAAEDSEAAGNQAGSAQRQASFEPRHLEGNLDHDEEDRLAYLRAQAAQDAALAGNKEDTTLTSLRQPNGKGHRGGRGGGGGGGGGRGRRGRGGGGGGGGGRNNKRGGRRGGSGSRSRSNM